MIKYTSDGRKVLVVGKLNSEQHIVQEIFISGDQEIPSGENFVVTGLHDAPVESWKEKRLRELDENYDKSIKNMEAQAKEAGKRLSLATSKVKERTKCLLAFAKNSDSEQLKTLYAFLSGEITHFFVNGYSPEIVTWDDNHNYDIDSWGGRIQVDGVKLISLFGRSDGRLDYRINHYRDGSGSSKGIIPCRSYEEALAAAQRSLNIYAAMYMEDKRHSLNVENWLKIEGIKIPDDAMKKYEANKQKNHLAKIKKLRDELEKLESQ